MIVDKSIEIEQKVIEICRQVSDSDTETKSKFSLNTEFGIENGLDSLALMNIVIEIEMEYAIVLDDYFDQISNARTIKDLVVIISDIV